MAELALAVAALVPKSSVKKATGAVKVQKPGGLSVMELLMQAVVASKERGSISLAALKKSLAASGYNVEKNNSHIKLGLKSLVIKGTLLQTKGTGALCSFKLNKKQANPKDKAAHKKKQPPARAKGTKRPTGSAKKLKKTPEAAGAKKTTKKAVKKPVSTMAKNKTEKPKKPKIPTKPLKEKAKVKPRTKSASKKK